MKTSVKIVIACESKTTSLTGFISFGNSASQKHPLGTIIDAACSLTERNAGRIVTLVTLECDLVHCERTGSRLAFSWEAYFHVSQPPYPTD